MATLKKNRNRWFWVLTALCVVALFAFSSCKKKGMASIAPNAPVQNGENENVHFDDDGENSGNGDTGGNSETGGDSDTDGDTDTEDEFGSTQAYEDLMASLSSTTTRVNFDGDFEDKFPADEDPFFGNWFYENNMLIEEWDPISTSGFEGFDFPGADIFDTPIKEGMVTFKVNFPDYPDNTGFSPEFYIYADVGDDDEIRVEFSTADGSPDFWPADFDATGKKFVAVFMDGLNSIENPNAMIDINEPHEFSVALINKGGKYQVSAFIDKFLIDVVDMDFGPNDIDGGFRFSNLERIRTWINPVGDEPIDNVTVEVHWIEYTPAK